MYPNLLKAMKQKNITRNQIADLLNQDHQMDEDCISWEKNRSISLEDADRIWKIFFPEYDFKYLFD